MPTLYLVGTPIGNLEDITLRALRILDEVELIAAEDTRRARQLLSAYNIKTPLTSYYEYSSRAKLSSLLQQLQEKDIAIISEAGMPGLNDPGYQLVNAALHQGIRVEPVPGASALVTAAVVSGLPVEQFLYLGFLPRRKEKRSQLLKSIIAEPYTIIALEAPHRIQSTLVDLLAILGDRQIAVARELTKIHEEVFHGRISEAKEWFSQPKGEFTLVIEGNRREDEEFSLSEIEERLSQLYHKGIKAKEAVSEVAGVTGLSKREIYGIWVHLSETIHKEESP